MSDKYLEKTILSAKFILFFIVTFQFEITLFSLFLIRRLKYLIAPTVQYSIRFIENLIVKANFSAESIIQIWEWEINTGY